MEAESTQTNQENVKKWLFSIESVAGEHGCKLSSLHNPVFQIESNCTTHQHSDPSESFEIPKINPQSMKKKTLCQESIVQPKLWHAFQMHWILLWVIFVRAATLKI